MKTNLIHTGVALLAVGAVGIIIAIVMEIQTGEPVYLLLMKATALLFGVGGSLIGFASLGRNRRS